MSRARTSTAGSTEKAGARTKAGAAKKAGGHHANARNLDSFRAVADAITQLFPPYTEVVLHDLGSQTVVHVANNLSKREIGDDSALDEIGFDVQESVIGPYEKLGWDGRKVRSISVVLRNEDGVEIGVMCINFHLAALDQAKQALEMLVSSAVLQPQPAKLFRDDWQDRVNVFLNHWLQERKLTLSMLTREHKRELVAALYEEGAFNGKSAANYVAKLLALGRATIFNYLKDLRGEG
ncbi:PAS domain-containing protein [Burkholderia cenocepacia]|uniref:helix-turn-helix transcriptional regulator n=1 Tax=Burkholderia cenocepacia TaxID=95486 RepID=UPI001B9BD278|nr:PAS domain-containing protein [Burkholderia cenocepacia]MBR8167956.1 PAS domain-containing protein [Burkholderia cenocepacia]